MKIAIPLAFVTAGFFLWAGYVIDMPGPPAPGGDPKITTIASQARFAENPIAGLVREVTAYNVGVREQTSDEPCVGATGRNLCRLVERGLKVCAANFVEPETILNIEGYGECIVLDRMHRRFSHRVDIAMGTDEVERAIAFGIQRLYVKVITGGP